MRDFIGLVLVAVLAVLIPLCLAFAVACRPGFSDTAVDALQTACEANIVQDAAVLAEAERLEVEPSEVAAYVCAVPAVYNAFQTVAAAQGEPRASARNAVDVAKMLEVLP